VYGKEMEIIGALIIIYLVIGVLDAIEHDTKEERKMKYWEKTGYIPPEWMD